MSADHTPWEPLLPYLDRHFTVHAMDRRGRGASGDGPTYSLQQEFEDVAAVVDAVAASSGREPDVYGHSSGGVYAFGAAALTTNMRKLVLYEGWPSLDPQPMASDAFIEQAEELLAAGDREGVVEALMRDLVQMSEDDPSTYRSLPAWRHRVATAHTIAREMRTEAQTRLDRRAAAQMSIPILMLVGKNTPASLKRDSEEVAAALPNARIEVLTGQQHTGDVLAPAAFAEVLMAFLDDGV